jgi:hypothetical protein
MASCLVEGLSVRVSPSIENVVANERLDNMTDGDDQG